MRWLLLMWVGAELLNGCAAAAKPGSSRMADWPVAEPQDVGLSQEVLDQLDSDIADGNYGNVDSMLILRHGRLVYERSYVRDYDALHGELARTPGPLNSGDPTSPYNYFNPWWHPYFRRGELHSMQSVTKTVTSVVIGVARTRGEFPDLDTPILSYFRDVQNADERKSRITIRHLLTMTGGIDWNEDLPYHDANNSCTQMEQSHDWVRFTIDRPMAHEPGTVFAYNSGATQLLAHVFHRATGVDVEEYAVEHLFRPLRIEDHYWKRTPTGLADTEGGLYLRPRDLAKIAQLYLDGGVFEGLTLVDPEFVKASVTPSVDVSPQVRYGYKWWLRPYGADGSQLAWCGSGFGGQMPIILPDLCIVMVFTAWNIASDAKRLSHAVAIERVLAAVRDASAAR